MERQRRRLGQWSTQEQETEAMLNEQQQREEWLGVRSAELEQDDIHDATVQTAQVATRKANQERWSRIKNVCKQRDCVQKNAGGMTDVTAAMHMYVAWKSGSIAKQDKTEETEMPKETHRLDQTDQDKTENAVMAPHPNQEQDKTEETVVHKEAQRTLQTMEDTMMPKKTQCIDQIEQDMQRLYAEVQKADTEAEISMAIMQKIQSEEQEQNMGFKTGQQRQDTEFQDQQQTMSENEVKRVVKLDKAGNIGCDREGQEILNKKFEETCDECSMEAKKEEHMLRHWECTIRSEEIELRKQELQLRQEQDKHEIEMQERKNTLEMQQDEHKRRMNSALW